MFRIRMISLPIHADMRLYERICAHIFPIRIVYSDQIYIDRINSIYMRFFCIFGYTYSMQISMWFHADMRSSMRINRNTYALKKTELENLYQTLTSKSEQNLFLRKLPIKSVLVSSQISDYNSSLSNSMFIKHCIDA